MVDCYLLPGVHTSRGKYWNMDKQAVRETVWNTLETTGEARFPFPPHGRIPNFAGASDACDRLTNTTEWRTAETLKCNPDAPQLPVRRAALRAGKTVYVAQPRLRDPDPFLRLDPGDIDDIDEATTVSGISTHGTPTAPEAIPHIDLVVSGSVGVTTDGSRIGKGEGYSDLEWGVLSELGAVGGEAQSASSSRAKPDDTDTTVATTVHELSVVDGLQSPIADPDELPDADAHDVPLDLIATPERVIRTNASRSRPAGIDWDALDAEKLAEIPVLVERKQKRE